MRTMLASLVIVLVLLFASLDCVHAQGSVTETGYAINLIAGSEKEQKEYIVAIKEVDGSYVRIVGNTAYVRGNYFLLQVVPNEANCAEDFKIWVATAPVINTLNRTEMTFMEKFGWTAQVPMPTADCPWDTPLKFQFDAIGAKKNYVRFVFKVTYGKSTVTEYKTLLIRKDPAAKVASAPSIPAASSTTANTIVTPPASQPAVTPTVAIPSVSCNSTLAAGQSRFTLCVAGSPTPYYRLWFSATGSAGQDGWQLTRDENGQQLSNLWQNQPSIRLVAPVGAKVWLRYQYYKQDARNCWYILAETPPICVTVPPDGGTVTVNLAGGAR